MYWQRNGGLRTKGTDLSIHMWRMGKGDKNQAHGACETHLATWVIQGLFYFGPRGGCWLPKEAGPAQGEASQAKGVKFKVALSLRAMQVQTLNVHFPESECFLQVYALVSSLTGKGDLPKEGVWGEANPWGNEDVTSQPCS